MIECSACWRAVRIEVSTSLTDPPTTIRYLPEQIVRAKSSSNRRCLQHVVLNLIANTDAGKFDCSDGAASGVTLPSFLPALLNLSRRSGTVGFAALGQETLSACGKTVLSLLTVGGVCSPKRAGHFPARSKLLSGIPMVRYVAEDMPPKLKADLPAL